MQNEKCIRIWAWADAPETLRGMSEHGGDEDWVASLPSHFKDKWIGWLESPAFGADYGEWQQLAIELEDGSFVLIGAH